MMMTMFSEEREKERKNRGGVTGKKERYTIMNDDAF